jgi:hypothetical protein
MKKGAICFTERKPWSQRPKRMDKMRNSDSAVTKMLRAMAVTATVGVKSEIEMMLRRESMHLT